MIYKYLKTTGCKQESQTVIVGAIYQKLTFFNFLID